MKNSDGLEVVFQLQPLILDGLNMFINHMQWLFISVTGSLTFFLYMQKPSNYVLATFGQKLPQQRPQDF